MGGLSAARMPTQRVTRFQVHWRIAKALPEGAAGGVLT
jgi:hypothetical protein